MLLDLFLSVVTMGGMSASASPQRSSRKRKDENEEGNHDTSSWSPSGDWKPYAFKPERRSEAAVPTYKPLDCEALNPTGTHELPNWSSLAKNLHSIRADKGTKEKDHPFKFVNPLRKFGQEDADESSVPKFKPLDCEALKPISTHDLPDWSAFAKVKKEEDHPLRFVNPLRKSGQEDADGSSVPKFTSLSTKEPHDLWSAFAKRPRLWEDEPYRGSVRTELGESIGFVSCGSLKDILGNTIGSVSLSGRVSDPFKGTIGSISTMGTFKSGLF